MTNFARIQVKRRLLHFNADSDEIKRFQDTLKRIQGRVYARFVSHFKANLWPCRLGCVDVLNVGNFPILLLDCSG